MQIISKQTCVVVFAIAFINFASFWVMAVLLGGDALSGKVVDGQFFLGNRDQYTQVSEAIYEYSLWHTRSTWITHPLGLLAGYIYYRLGKDYS